MALRVLPNRRSRSERWTSRRRSSPSPKKLSFEWHATHTSAPARRTSPSPEGSPSTASPTAVFFAKDPSRTSGFSRPQETREEPSAPPFSPGISFSGGQETITARTRKKGRFSGLLTLRKRRDAFSIRKGQSTRDTKPKTRFATSLRRFLRSRTSSGTWQVVWSLDRERWEAARSSATPARPRCNRR